MAYLQQFIYRVMKTTKFLSQITSPENYAYDALVEICSGSATVEEAEANILSMINSLRDAGDKLVCLRLNGETKLT